MVLKVGLVHNIVNETSYIRNAGCISCRVRTVEVELEVRELSLDLSEVLKVECLDECTCSIEEMHCLLGLKGLEELHNVAAERSHTCSTTHEDVLLAVRVILRKKELSVRT